ncbi:hypothetical protein [Burkholderia pyrrocinia]
MATISKEDVYDDRISPLMAQILSICKDHTIAMLASFSIHKSAAMTALYRDSRGQDRTEIKMAAAG